MKSFSFNCWVPSLGGYVKIRELKVVHIDLMSKYILNDDLDGLCNYFDELLEELLVVPSILRELTRYDKWFILTFLRASNVGESIYINTKYKDNTECTVEINLFDLLTKFSEIDLTIDKEIMLEKLSLSIAIPKKLYLKNILSDSIEYVTFDTNKININTLSLTEKQGILNKIDGGLLDYIKRHILIQETKFQSNFLIESKEEFADLSPVALRLFDNTLFFFLKSIFTPLAKGLYTKKYILINKVGMTLMDINMLTPLECDVYINTYNSEENNKKNKSY